MVPQLDQAARRAPHGPARLLVPLVALALALPELAHARGHGHGLGSNGSSERGDQVPPAPTLADTVPAAPDARPKPERFGDLAPRDVASSPPAPGSSPASPSAPGTEDARSWVRWWRYNGPALISDRPDHGPARVHRSGDEFFLGRGQSSVTPPVERPSVPTIRSEVAPALLEVLEGKPAAEVEAAVLMALAKLGSARAGRLLLPVLARRLDHRDLPVAEAAVLSMGILGEDAAAPWLLALAADGPAGHALCGRSTVPIRVRTFAILGLGLLADRSSDAELQRRIAADLLRLLEEDSEARPDVTAAAVTSLGLTTLPWSPAARPERPSRGDLSARLRAHLSGDRQGRGALRHHDARAQIPVALGRLLAPSRRASDPRAQAHLAETVNLMLTLAHRRSTERSERVRQSILIALGQLSTSGGEGDLAADRNRRVQRALTAAARASAHGMTESFALVALARQGGAAGSGPRPFDRLREAEAVLLERLERGTTRERAWSALALGVLARGAQGGGLDLLPGTFRRLEGALADARSPELTGALAVALGLAGDIAAAPLLLGRFDQVSDGRARAQLAVGLGLMGSAAASAPLLEALEEGRHQPDLAEQLGVAIGMVASAQQLEATARLLERETPRGGGLPLALPVGRAGHPSGVRSLVALLRFPGGVRAARAQAATALGIACDKDEVPWSARLGVDVHYGVEIETLVNSERTGILDAY